MGNAEFCPLCGEITGGWQLPYEPHTCRDRRSRPTVRADSGKSGVQPSIPALPYPPRPTRKKRPVGRPLRKEDV